MRRAQVREATARHYARNPEQYRTRHRQARQRKYEFLINLKATTPCKDCDRIFEHYIMEFDHVLPILHGRVMTLIRQSWHRIREELERVELVCANCHRRRTWKRRVSGAGVEPA